MMMSTPYRKICLKDYKVEMYLGIFEHEKKHKQTVIINIEAYIDLPNLNDADTIEATFNYQNIVQAIEDITKEPIELQETLCNRLASSLLSYKAIYAVKIACEKPQAYQQAKSIGLEIFLAKSSKR